jgi:hypothetical protein
MCFTLSNLVTTGRWNWEGDKIVYRPIICGARKTPNKKRLYDIDIREFLTTKDNEVITTTIGRVVDELQPEGQALFRSHRRGSFDYRVQVISKYFFKHFKYIPGNRKFDYWLFPDETIAEAGGDCEDRAILLAALLLASGISGYVVRVALGRLYDAETKKSKDHAWVMYKNEDGKWMCLEPLLLSKEAKKASRKLALRKTIPQQVQYEYIPFFIFNDCHLWAMKNNADIPTLSDYLRGRSFWAHFDPEFAAGVHNDIFDLTLGDMDEADLFYVKACSLALDTVSSYDPREHFDNGYIEEGWSLLREYLKHKNLNNLTYALHAVADFYAHTSYAQFAPRETDGKRIALYNDAVSPQLNAEYAVEPFNLNDINRFSVNPYFYKDTDRTKAVAYCDKQQIISGRFAQPRDPSQTFLEKNFVYIPYDMRHAKDFPDRGSLPHHNEIAVDAPLGKDNKLPDAHMLYQTPKGYQEQFNLRFDAAKRHVTQEYEQWKLQNKN